MQSTRKGYAPTPENLAKAKAIVLRGWKARAKERSLPEPIDASGGCKFASLFFQALFGGEIKGNVNHQYNVLNGQVFDLNEDCEDVRGFKRYMQVYEHDAEFFGNDDHLASMSSCLPRVMRWVAEFDTI